MNFLKIIFLFSFCVLSSCGGHLTISPRGCQTSALWAVDRVSYRPSWVMEEKVYVDSSMVRTLFLKDIIEKENLQCRQLKQVKVILKQTWKDVLYSIPPFLSRYSVIVEAL